MMKGLPQNHWWRIVLGVGVLVALVIFFFWTHFVITSYSYAKLAMQGPAQLDSVERVEAEAIVVLTGDALRIPGALNLLRQRGSALLVISGVFEGAPLIDVINQQVGAAYRINETWKDIVVDSASRTTLENAHHAAKILREKQIRRIILVTSDYHMNRALAIFTLSHPDLEVIPYPTPSAFSHMVSQTIPITIRGLWKLSIEFSKLLLYRIGLLG